MDLASSRFIDGVQFTTARTAGRGTMRRVKELIDVWFDFRRDAGGAVALPFENG
jgi:isoleucyl-tRNA synthetase